MRAGGQVQTKYIVRAGIASLRAVGKGTLGFLSEPEEPCMMID